MNKESRNQLLLAGLALAVMIGMFVIGQNARSADSDVLKPVAEDERSDLPLMEDFVLPDLRGTDVRFSDFVGDRPFAVTFGQTTCPPCVQQSIAFKALEEEYGNEVALLKVYIGQSPEVAARQVEQLQSPTQTLIDLEGRIYRRYGHGPIPVTVVGDAKGRIMAIGSYYSQESLGDFFDSELAGAKRENAEQTALAS